MRLNGYIPIILVTAALAVVPLVFSSNTLFNFMVMSLIITLAAQGWNILGGVAGQTSFGHALFFGVGCYTAAMLQFHFGVNAWIAFFLALLAGAAAGFVLGFLSFRAGLRGSYFALITLAFAELMRILANASEWTGGAAGLLLKLDPGLANMQFESRASFLWLALAFVFVGLVISRAIAGSRFGAHLVAVRENEDAARALGVGNWTIMFRHLLPNAMVATLTFLPFILSGSITTLTSLDFLGFGMPPGSPSLGELIAQGKRNLQAPWLGLTAFFTMSIMLSLLIFVGEAVRDAFDPRKTFR